MRCIKAAHYDTTEEVIVYRAMAQVWSGTPMRSTVDPFLRYTTHGFIISLHLGATMPQEELAWCMLARACPLYPDNVDPAEGPTWTSVCNEFRC